MITFVAVVAAFVVFRAAQLGDAIDVCRAWLGCTASASCPVRHGLRAHGRGAAGVRQRRAEHVGGHWPPTPARRRRAGPVAAFAVLQIADPSPFLYFQFEASLRLQPSAKEGPSVGDRPDHVDRASARRARRHVPAGAVRAAPGRCDPRERRQSRDLRPPVRRHRTSAARARTTGRAACATSRSITSPTTRMFDFDLAEALSPVDCGDCDVILGDAAAARSSARRPTSRRSSPAAPSPSTLGGEHSVTIPAVSAIPRRSSPTRASCWSTPTSTPRRTSAASC